MQLIDYVDNMKIALAKVRKGENFLENAPSYNEKTLKSFFEHLGDKLARANKFIDHNEEIFSSNENKPEYNLPNITKFISQIKNDTILKKIVSPKISKKELNKEIFVKLITSYLEITPNELNDHDFCFNFLSELNLEIAKFQQKNEKQINKTEIQNHMEFKPFSEQLIVKDLIKVANGENNIIDDYQTLKKIVNSANKQNYEIKYENLEKNAGISTDKFYANPTSQISETVGMRISQEDASLSVNFKGNFTQNEIVKILRHNMNVTFEDGKNFGGTTSNMLHISPENILTIANIGENRATIYAYYKEFDEVKPIRMNYAHNISDEIELAEIYNNHGYVANYRVAANLKTNANLKSARGINDYNEQGHKQSTSNRADLSIYNLNNIKADEIILLQASDGLYERLSEIQVANLIRYALKERRNISDILNIAIKFFETDDNVSVITHNLKPNITREENIFSIINDGRGGAISSNALVQFSYNNLCNYLASGKMLDNKIDKAEGIKLAETYSSKDWKDYNISEDISKIKDEISKNTKEIDENFSNVNSDVTENPRNKILTKTKAYRDLKAVNKGAPENSEIENKITSEDLKAANKILSKLHSPNLTNSSNNNLVKSPKNNDILSENQKDNKGKSVSDTGEKHIINPVGPFGKNKKPLNIR